ncbi:MAG: pyridoxamine 5'-phosphate oxidase family protein [Clostridium sp.]
MNKVIEFLKENPVQYLATVGRDGKAKCRPFMFAGEMDGKLWFAQITQRCLSRYAEQSDCQRTV